MVAYFLFFRKVVEIILKSIELTEKINEAKNIALKHPSQAFEMASMTLEQAQMERDKHNVASSLFVMSLACRSMTKLDKCYDYAYDAYQIFKDLKDIAGEAKTLNLIGIVYFYNAMYEKSLENFLRALKLVKKTDDFATLSRIYNNMGEVYREAGNPEEAILAYNKALDVSESLSLKMNIAVILENIGQIYFDQGNLEESSKYYQKSYGLLIDLDDEASLAEVENKIGKIYFLQQNFEQAKQYQKQALHRLENIGNKYYAIEVLLDLAEFEHQNNETAFLNFLYQAQEYAEEIQARQQLSKIYYKLSIYYEAEGKFDLALTNYKKYHHIEQTIESNTMTHKLEIIKVELNKLFAGQELEEIAEINEQLELEISKHREMMKKLEQTNLDLSAEVLMDDLTQLANRKGVKKYLSKFLNDNTYTVPLAVLMIDVDYFKRYNDYHGHIEGDRCLREVAACMKDVLGTREGIVGRFGGEEFICILKGVNREGLIKFAEELRAAVMDLSQFYEWENRQYPVTVSVGGVFGKFDSTKDMLLSADEELYRAKKCGRNQVKVR